MKFLKENYGSSRQHMQDLDIGKHTHIHSLYLTGQKLAPLVISCYGGGYERMA